jgi:cellulose synthase/poly-beta-1,6-N-acetylglucosamine synthase-like glycosyltransferase
MIVINSLIAGLTVLFTVIQSFLAFGLLRKLRQGAQVQPVEDAALPLTAVLLCLRGGDPFLPRTLSGLLSQNYPRYQVRIIVDSKSDPAWQVASDAVAQYPLRDAKVCELKNYRVECGLKCSSLLQAVQSLDENVEVIAQLDADTIPHPNWLRELVAPLLDPTVGAATGNRWYMPEQATIGSLMRYFWNAAAIVLMYWCRIPWGGTLAIKRSLLRQSDLMERWGKAFCEDTMLYTVLCQHKLRLAFVPSLMMINREDCDVGGFFRWVSRQLLTARLYHPGWPKVVLHGVSLTLLPALCLVAIGWGMRQGNFTSVTGCIIALTCLEISLFMLLVMLERSMRRVAASRNEPTGWLSRAMIGKSIIALPLLQMVYPLSMAVAYLRKIVDWRGVSYRIDGSWQIRLMQYRPYAVSAFPAERIESL